MMYWAYGTDETGETAVVGPFEFQEQAEMRAEIQELRNIQTVSGRNRQQAMAQINGRPQRSMLSADESLPVTPSFPASPEEENF